MAQSASEDFIDKLLERAVLENASDIHIEPFENNFQVRLRTPVGLKSFPTPQHEVYQSVARTLKLMAKLDIATTQRPQDGKFEKNLGGESVEFRLASLPTIFGESFVMRVLDRNRIPLDVDGLGFSDDICAALKRALENPYGLIAVVGPTGSGKTTTLYACLRYLLAKDYKIVSIEDPVEYALDGVQQASVSDRLDYPMALRSFLRHDPDVIFVGEIRDVQSAKLAVQASLTGHLVLTTLHTHSPSQSVQRLLDLGVAPQLLAASLRFVLAQRLELAQENTRRPVGEYLEMSQELAQKITQNASRKELAAFEKGCVYVA